MYSFFQKLVFPFFLFLPLLSFAHLEGPVSQNISVPTPRTRDNINKTVSPLAQDLKIPWSLDFLPDETILFTERAGSVKWFDPKSGNIPEVIHTFLDVAHESEGGLLGLAVHPKFSENSFVYFYHTYRDEKNQLANRVIRMKLKRNFHKQFGRLRDVVVGPDKMLYVLTNNTDGRGKPSEDDDHLLKINPKNL